MNARRSRQVAAVLLGFTVAALAVAPAQARGLDSIAVVVNEDLILASELEEAVRQIELQLRSQDRPPPPRDVLQAQVLERLILQRLQVQRAKSAGLQVDETELQQAIATIAKRNRMTVNEFMEAAAQEGVNFAQFREQIRSEILINKLRQREVDSRVAVSNQDVEHYLKERGAQKGENEYRVSHILVALKEGASEEDRTRVRRQAEEVHARAKAGEDFGQLALRYSNDQLALSGGDLGWLSAAALPSLFANVVPGMNPGSVSPLLSSESGFHIVRLDELRSGDGDASVVEHHVRHILLTPNTVRDEAATRAAATDLKRQLDEGADFAALARKHSNDSGSANQGGDLGWQAKGSFVPEFEAELAAMSPGELRGPFSTPFGWHIAQLMERRSKEAGDAQQRERARNAIFQRKATEEYDLWLRRLRDEAYVEYRLAQKKSG